MSNRFTNLKLKTKKLSVNMEKMYKKKKSLTYKYSYSNGT